MHIEVNTPRIIIQLENYEFTYDFKTEELAIYNNLFNKVGVGRAFGLHFNAAAGRLLGNRNVFTFDNQTVNNNIHIKLGTTRVVSCTLWVGRRSKGNRRDAKWRVKKII